MTDQRTPVVFVHGLWLHSSAWGAWIDRFRAAGYEPTAPGWPADADTVEQARENPDRVAGVGIDAVVEHYAAVIAGLPGAPVVIGHSFGGLIVQRLLGQDLAAAAVAIDAAPIKGVIYLPPSALRVASVALRKPSNRTRAISLTPEQFRYGFGNAIGADEAAELYRHWVIPSPARPLFEAATANLTVHSPAAVDTRNDRRGPLLLIAGGRDHTVPAAITRSTLKQYRHTSAVTDYKEFSDRGHSLVLDHGWAGIADYTLAWLGRHAL